MKYVSKTIKAHGILVMLRVLAGLWLLASCATQVGCQESPVEKEEAHHIPAHLPADFDQALTRVEQLVAHLKDGVSLEKMPTEVNVETELRDVVHWLPELAAQSDLKEADWNIVDAATIGLIEQFGQAKEPPEKWIRQDKTLNEIAALPQKLAEVRQKFRDMQIPDVVVEDEPESVP